jgi:hypothetical protein
MAEKQQLLGAKFGRESIPERQSVCQVNRQNDGLKKSKVLAGTYFRQDDSFIK